MALRFTEANLAACQKKTILLVCRSSCSHGSSNVSNEHSIDVDGSEVRLRNWMERNFIDSDRLTIVKVDADGGTSPRVFNAVSAALPTGVYGLLLVESLGPHFAP